MMKLVKPSDASAETCKHLLGSPESNRMRELCLENQYEGILDLDFIKEYAPNTFKVFLREHRKHGGKIPFDPGYVYLIHAVGTNFYKIGKSVTPNKRLTQISPKMPFECELIATRQSLFVSEAEKDYHSWLHDKRANGEWFEGVDKKLFLSPPDEVVMLAYVWNLANEIGRVFDGDYLETVCEYTFNPLGTSRFLALARVESVFNQITHERSFF